MSNVKVGFGRGLLLRGVLGLGREDKRRIICKVIAWSMDMLLGCHIQGVGWIKRCDLVRCLC